MFRLQEPAALPGGLVLNLECYCYSVNVAGSILLAVRSFYFSRDTTCGDDLAASFTTDRRESTREDIAEPFDLDINAQGAYRSGKREGAG